jgi:hypothetical protein
MIAQLRQDMNDQMTALRQDLTIVFKLVDQKHATYVVEAEKRSDKRHDVTLMSIQVRRKAHRSCGVWARRAARRQYWVRSRLRH